MTQLSLCPQTNIGILCQHSWHFLVALLACQQLGKRPVVFSNIQPRQAQEYAKQWQCLCDIPEVIASTNAISVSHLNKTSSSTNYPFAAIDSQQALLTLYTSGSTGQPSAVDKRLAQLELEAQTLEAQFGSHIVPNALFVGTVAHYHIYGILFRLLWPLLTQRVFDCTLIQTEENLQSLLATPLCFISSPAFLSRLTDMPSIQSQQVSFSSGGPLTIASAQATYKQLGNYPFEVYGSTETGGIAWRQQTQAAKPWRKFDLLSLSINDGCLTVNSPYIEGGKFMTQDCVTLHDDNHFSLQGRADRIVKIAEKRISLDALEHNLNACDGIVDCAVIAIAANKPGPNENQAKAQQLRIGAVVVLDAAWQQTYQAQGHSWLWKNIRQQLKGLIEPVALPRQIRVQAVIPKNQQAKRSYVELEKLFQ
nr:AMP-binding protein [Shewanella intestini]